MENKTYSLGLDIGTNSIGWAVVDDKNDLVRKNGFTFWGVRMFDQANVDQKSAKKNAQRRAFRTARRRLVRRRERIKIIQDIFANEISKVDKYFYIRLNDSFFKQEDKYLKNQYIFFNDDYTDKEFNKKYPTIYHLREALLNSDEKFDIRMIYLAVHHIIKYRGNFLTEGDFKLSNIDRVKEFFDSLNNVLVNMSNEMEEYTEYFDQIDNDLINGNDFYKSLKEILAGNKLQSERIKELKKLFGVENNKNIISELIIPLLSKKKVDVSKLSVVKDFKYPKSEIDIVSEELEQQINEAKANVNELCEVLDIIFSLKEVVDYYFLVKLVGNNNYLSSSFVSEYENHKKELDKLKQIIKKYIPAKYDECFKKYDKKINNYPHYVGVNSTKGKIERFSHCSKEQFYEYLKGLFKGLENVEEVQGILDKINKDNFLLRQNSSQNASIPMQLNLIELEQILKKQSVYYPFLLEEEDGLSNIDKIILTFKFKIPYYVGPLSTKSPRAWLKRSNEKILPWNFDKVVDCEESAKRFIEKMQNKCSYLRGDEDYCLPLNSILYQKYNCLNYLNMLRINGELISREEKERLFNEVFLNKSQKPTKKQIADWFIKNCGAEEDIIKTIPEVNCSMSSAVKFKEIFGDGFFENLEKKENIIKDITLLEDKTLLEKRLINVYKLDIKIAKQIKGLNYKNFGRLCNNLLNGIKYKDENTGEVLTLIEIMEKENMNFQQILFDSKYNFQSVIDEYNSKFSITAMNFKEYIEEELYVSPIMRRPLIQTYKLIEEIEKILKHKIDYYYVECTRVDNKGSERKKDATVSRYKQISELLKSSRSISKELKVDYNSLSYKLDSYKDNEGALRSDKIYLYFTQLGKDLYTMENIDFDSLNDYDIDHIYPQALIKDDSLSNRVLTKKDINMLKKDRFLFEIQEEIKRKNPNYDKLEAFAFYSKLESVHLITKEKKRRLTENSVSKEKIEGFVNRQIVATNQSVKGLIDLLKDYKKVNPTHIIYSKAEIINDFRKNYDFLKSRTANNFHHAHDAYLNAVIGRLIDKYYKIKNLNNSYYDYLKMKNDKVSINPSVIIRNDQYIVKNGEKVYYWKKEEVLRILNTNIKHRFDINETSMSFESTQMFSKTSIGPAQKDRIPVKTTDARIDTTKYGGIESHNFCKYCIIKLTDKKGKTSYSLEAIPKMFDKRINQYLDNVISSKYQSYEIINDHIKVQSVIEQDKLKYMITGKTNDSYLIKNLNDRYFSYDAIKTIRLLDKYLNQKKFGLPIELIDDNKIIISATKDKDEQVITIEKCNKLLDEIKRKLSLPIYDYSQSNNILKTIENINLKITDYVFVLSELLKFLKTNERTTSNLSLVGGSANQGIMTISKNNLKKGTKFVSESITGYYKKTIFEVPSE